MVVSGVIQLIIWLCQALNVKDKKSAFEFKSWASYKKEKQRVLEQADSELQGFYCSLQVLKAESCDLESKLQKLTKNKS